jgi:general secretion pathway protein H
MPMWAAGSDLAPTSPRFARFAAPRVGEPALRRLGVGHSLQHGFTLLELLVVLMIIAIGTAGVTFAFRDSQATLLEREAQRLSVILETARVQSRSSGVALVWLPLPQGFVVMPASRMMASREVPIDAAAVSPWLSQDVRAQVWVNASTSREQRSASALVLGAEPMIAPASVLLSVGDRQLRIATDGLRPFEVVAQDSAVAQP